MKFINFTDELNATVETLILSGVFNCSQKSCTIELIVKKVIKRYVRIIVFRIEVVCFLF